MKKEDIISKLGKNDCYKKYDDINSNIIYGRFSNIRPSFSIIIPTYQRPQELKAALNSALHQKTDIMYEVIVIDNDPDINTETVLLMKQYCNKYGNLIYLKNEKNIGMFGNWNRCIQICRSDWFCLLADDDAIKSNYISEVYPIIIKSNAGIVGTYKSYINETDNAMLGFNKITNCCINFFITVFGSKSKKITINDILNGRGMPCPPMAINKNKALAIGGFDCDVKACAGAYFYAKMSYCFGTEFILKRLAYYRLSVNETFKKEVCVNALEENYFLLNVVCDLLNIKNRKWHISKGMMMTYYVWPNRQNGIEMSDVIEKYNLSPILKYNIICCCGLAMNKVGWLKIVMRRNQI